MFYSISCTKPRIRSYTASAGNDASLLSSLYFTFRKVSAGQNASHRQRDVVNPGAAASRGPGWAESSEDAVSQLKIREEDAETCSAATESV